MRYSVYIFLLLFLLYGCSSSSVREQYGLKLKEFPIDCDSLIKSIEIDRLGDAEFSSEVTQVDENIVKVHILLFDCILKVETDMYFYYIFIHLCNFR